ncbi:B3 domain-containing transcription factor VRN1, partial [Mucuna pruriens]
MTCNHPLPSEILFFKIILYTTLQHGKLKIPNKFTREHGANLSNPLFLKLPDGIEWKVYWTKDDGGGIWFQKGWKEFAAYYSLNQGHLLLFKYQETCHLEVHIFDQSTLEISYPSHPTQNENDNIDHISNKPVQVLDEVTSIQKTKLKSTISCPKPQSQKTGSSGVVGQSSNLLQHVQIKGEQSQFTNFARSSDKEVTPSHKTKLKSIIPGPQPQDMGGATESQKVERLISKATNRAATSESKGPSFMVVLQPSYAYGYSMIIPTAFAKKYLKEKPRDDILLRNLDGRTWLISFRLGRFRKGWKTFVSDNHLNAGDVCLFELTKSGGHCFQVSFIRLSQETQSPGDGDPGRIPDSKCISALPIKAMQEARKFTSENPFFRVIIKANCNRDFRPRVPVAFVRKHLGEKQIVMLQFLKKSWHVNIIGDVRTKLSKGWTKFAIESKLRQGDVCIFELIDKANALNKEFEA